VPTYYTYKAKVPLKPGEKLGFTSGKGYYAIPAPTAKVNVPLPAQGSGPTAPDVFAPLADASASQLGVSQTTLNQATQSGSVAGVAPPEITDWGAYLGLTGLDQEALQAINAVKRTGDLTTDIPNILNAVRQTQWYARTYPGIGNAIAKGLVTNEAGYRAMQNQFNQVYQQYYGRPIALGEFAGFLGEGIDAGILQKRIQGDQYIQANKGDIQYVAGAFGEGRLSDSELQDVGRNQAGLGTQQGASLQSALDKALQRAQRIFQGTLASMDVNRNSSGRISSPGNADVGR